MKTVKWMDLCGCSYLCPCAAAVEGIDPAYQADSQSRRCALHAAAQRGFLEVCYLLVEVSSTADAPSVCFTSLGHCSRVLGVFTLCWMVHFSKQVKVHLV